MSISDNNCYRVEVYPDTGKVQVMSFDLDCIDVSALGLYDSINNTPDWIQERIATLMLVDPTPPTKEVNGIGHRIDQTTYWVYA